MSPTLTMLNRLTLGVSVLQRPAGDAGSFSIVPVGTGEYGSVRLPFV
jgi:hypothetical protein